jgi:hypothetical protein
VAGIELVVQYTDNAGRRQLSRYNVAGQLPPGRIASVSTGLGPYTAGSGCPAEVVAARIVE